MPPASELERIWAQIKDRPPLRRGEWFEVDNTTLQVSRATLVDHSKKLTENRDWIGQMMAGFLGLPS